MNTTPTISSGRREEHDRGEAEAAAPPAFQPDDEAQDMGELPM
jgi:hypothetical protein